MHVVAADRAVEAMRLVCEFCEDALDWFDGQGNVPLHYAAQAK